MLLYQDIITGDELVSDAYPMYALMPPLRSVYTGSWNLAAYRKLVDDIVYEVESQLITIKEGADVNIGANPSAEEQEEALADGAKQVNNVVNSFRLQTTAFDKKSYLTHLKVRCSYPL